MIRKRKRRKRKKRTKERIQQNKDSNQPSKLRILLRSISVLCLSKMQNIGMFQH